MIYKEKMSVPYTPKWYYMEMPQDLMVCRPLAQAWPDSRLIEPGFSQLSGCWCLEVPNISGHRNKSEVQGETERGEKWCMDRHVSGNGLTGSAWWEIEAEDAWPDLFTALP